MSFSLGCLLSVWLFSFSFSSAVVGFDMMPAHVLHVRVVVVVVAAAAAAAAVVVYK